MGKMNIRKLWNKFKAWISDIGHQYLAVGIILEIVGMILIALAGWFL